ncbi:MAG: glycosyltransferase [Polyangiaceae bacterium]
MGDRVHFPGEVPFTKMTDFYAHADVFVHASLSETYGNVMGEALWCGTPTVSFRRRYGRGLADRGRRERHLARAGVVVGRRKTPPTRRSVAPSSVSSKIRRGAELGHAARRGAQRSRAHPQAIQAKIVDAFRSAQDHAAACGLRPMLAGPRALQWYTTFQHFRPWTTVMGSIYLAGHLRPAKTKRKEALQPQFAGPAAPRRG